MSTEGDLIDLPHYLRSLDESTFKLHISQVDTKHILTDI